MRYISFEISNYKGIKHLIIDLSGKPETNVYTFVGLNESGKTTILEAINIINEGYKKDQETSLIPKSQKSGFTGVVSVEAEIGVDQQDNKRIGEFLKTLGYNFFMDIESYNIDAQCVFENSTLVKRTYVWSLSISVKKSTRNRKWIDLWESQPDEWRKVANHIEEKLMPKIIYFENFLFKFPERIYLTKDISEQNQKYYSVLEDILQTIIPNGSLMNDVVALYNKSDSESRDLFDARTTKIGDIISKEVGDSWGQLFNTPDFNPEIVLRFGSDPKRGVYTELRIKEKGEIFYISERSLGFQWFFSFLFFTRFRIDRKTDFGETLFLFDEPASNLHSGAQKRLLQTFQKFISNSSRPVKLLYTTHSHHLINPKWLEGAFVIKNNAVNYNDVSFTSTETDITSYKYKQFASQYPSQTDYFQPILDTLDYQPGLLEKVPNIIVTEGKFDYYIFRYFKDVIFSDISFDDIHLYPGMGCNKNFEIIALYLGWGKDFTILLDSDEAGEKAKQLYEKEFGLIISDNIHTYYTLVPEIGKVAVEDIFNESEKITISQIFDPSLNEYKKSAFNTAIQTLLLSNEKIELSENTKNKAQKLLEKLQPADFE